MVAIHEKIVHLLDTRKLKRRDLARALAVSPQTATDICKGRSAVTIPHLRNLVAWFNLRPDYWLDNERLEPALSDRLVAGMDQKLDAIARTGILLAESPEQLFERMRRFIAEHGAEFENSNPDLGAEERGILGLDNEGPGMVGRVF